ncbi:transposase zinc-binding domain-containing protein [Moritella sp. JT01]|uniref:transposase zinc-binding domain-containing protein n=1 Tax=Moritella sp. JT01 TaxID=756698 RepID=UPI003516CCE6
MTKLLACSTQLMGVKEFSCSSSDCQHVKYIRQTCKSRGCSSCGKKSTDQWIATQMIVTGIILPLPCQTQSGPYFRKTERYSVSYLN